MNTLPRLIAVLAACALTLPLAARAEDETTPAETEPGAPTQVTIAIQVIAASPAKGEVDKRLTKLSKRMSDFAFNSYRLLSEQTIVLGPTSKETLQLPGNRTLTVQPRKFEKSGKVKMHLHLFGKTEAKLIDAQYAVEPGGDLLVGGPKFEDGALLIYMRHESAKAP